MRGRGEEEEGRGEERRGDLQPACGRRMWTRDMDLESRLESGLGVWSAEWGAWTWGLDLETRPRTWCLDLEPGVQTAESGLGSPDLKSESVIWSQTWRADIEFGPGA